MRELARMIANEITEGFLSRKSFDYGVDFQYAVVSKLQELGWISKVPPGIFTKSRPQSYLVKD